MGAHVVGVARTLGEASMANSTCIWLHSCMQAHVRIQVSRRRERFFTELTFVRLGEAPVAFPVALRRNRLSRRICG